MSKIKFRGIEYDSLADMPAKVRHDYFKSRAGYDVTEEKTQGKEDMMPTGMENMPDEVREIYERVRGNLDAKPIKTSPIDELPKTEDLYRRSAPAGMQNLPSDEVVYKPSPPIIKPPPPIVESDHTLRRLLLGLAVLLLMLGVVLAIYFGN
ncbi:MAG: hypothetical protein AB8I58_03015 [Anaerolineales bacterium]|jgi:hypothetical protein